MASEFDSSDFVDTEFETGRTSPYVPGSVAPSQSGDFVRGPSRDEIDSKVSDAHLKLAELKRAQEELERERAALEETRRRQIEYQTGREEMAHALTRGVALLEESEFAARRDAEQMAKALAGLKEALRKVQSLQEETWSKENYNIELTRALTTLENARMEWNTARLKFGVLSNDLDQNRDPQKNVNLSLAQMSLPQLCKIGLAFSWPLVLLGLIIFATLILRH